VEDAKIIELYWERDERAVSETEKKYGKYCHSIAFGVLRNELDAEECVNDAYLRVWESNLFGMGIDNYYRGSYDQGQRYVLLHFDGYEIHEVINAEIGGWLGSHRAVYIDGYFYMLGGEDLIVRNLDAQSEATPAK
jgi:hypothetical protein